MIKYYLVTKLDTKKKIVKKALELIAKKGYNNVSSRMIAREVGISVSTLFYHYPEGLIDILLDSYQFFEIELKLKDIFFDGKITDEDIKSFFHRQLKMGRKMKDLIFALESALFADPEYFKSKSSKVVNEDLEELMMVKKLYEKIAGNEISMGLLFKMISVWKALVRRHIIFDNIYGSDEDFTNMMIKILRAIANEDY